MKSKIKEITGFQIKKYQKLKRGIYVRFASELSAYKAFIKLLQAGYGATISPSDVTTVYIKGAFKPTRVRS